MVRLIDHQTLSGGMARRTQSFERQARRAAHHAATRATDASRARFLGRLSGRPTTKPRPGRPTTRGAFADHVAWRPIDGGHRVGVDVVELQRVAPYWLIQEIGTGMSAKVAHGGLGRLRGGQGRSGPREPGNVKIKSQVGRRIPSGLVWSGSRVGQDQIVPGPQTAPIVIRSEIPGKHYLRTGGNRGFALYERELEQIFFHEFGDHPKP